jgi:tetratricopeptide (TPR) repeat protein
MIARSMNRPVSWAGRTPPARRLAVVVSALAACLALSEPLHAEGSAPAPGASETERANELFRRAKAAFAADNLDEAQRLYAAAWELKKSPDIAANLAQTELELGNMRAAAQHFSYALRNLLPSSTDQQRAALAQGLAKARAEVCLLRLVIEPRGAEVSIDGVLVGKSPIDEPVFVEPGQRSILARSAGYVTGETRVDAQKGGEQTVELALAESAVEAAPGPMTAAPEQPKADTPEPARAQRTPAYVAMGVALAGVGLGVGFWVVASGKESEAQDIRDELAGRNSCGSGTPYAEQCGRLKDTVASKQTATAISITGVGVGALSAGLAAYWFLRSSPANAGSAGRVIPLVALAPGERLLGVAGRF